MNTVFTGSMIIIAQIIAHYLNEYNNSLEVLCLVRYPLHRRDSPVGLFPCTVEENETRTLSSFCNTVLTQTVQILQFLQKEQSV